MKKILKAYTFALLAIIGFAIGFGDYHLSRASTEFASASPVLALYPDPVLVRTSIVEVNLEDSAKNAINSQQTPKVLQSCEGNWIYTDSIGQKLNINQINLAEWTADNKPSIVNETINTKNKVVIGHNSCTASTCNNAGTEFAKIINSKFGDNAALCLNNLLYEGKIESSYPVFEDAVYIMGDWLNGESVTMFTCYGECKDAFCTATKERWVTAFKVI